MNDLEELLLEALEASHRAIERATELKANEVVALVKQAASGLEEALDVADADGFIP